MTSIILLAQHVKLLKQSLSRILMHTDGSFEIIVVNDGASDEIAAWLGKADDTKTVATDRLAGVAKGYNLGAAEATGDKLVFMRDHMYVAEGWLDSLNACLDKHSDAAMVGPVCNGISGAQRLGLSCETMQQLNYAAQAMAVTREGKSRLVSRLISGLLLIRRKTFEELGGFDERFELEAYEDDDLCYRALRRGYRLYVAEDCFVRYETPPALFPGEPDWYVHQMKKNKLAAMNKWGEDITEALANWRYRPTVSLCIVARNAGQTLEQCLSLASGIADEVVVVDAGSTDETGQVAEANADKAAKVAAATAATLAQARIAAAGLATRDYILWLEADECIRAADVERFKELVRTLPDDTEYVTMLQELPMDEAYWTSASLPRAALAKRKSRSRLHVGEEAWPAADTKRIESDIVIHRVSARQSRMRDLSLYERKWSSESDMPVEEMLAYADGLTESGLTERALVVYDRVLYRSEADSVQRIRACAGAADCLAELGRLGEAKGRAMQSFAYALPRAELCCRLAYYFTREGNDAEAVQWYSAALGVPRPACSDAWTRPSAWTWLPHLQLSACYIRLGRYDLARLHIEAAGENARTEDEAGTVAAFARHLQAFILFRGGKSDERFEEERFEEEREERYETVAL